MTPMCLRYASVVTLIPELRNIRRITEEEKTENGIFR